MVWFAVCCEDRGLTSVDRWSPRKRLVRCQFEITDCILWMWCFRYINLFSASRLLPQTTAIRKALTQATVSVDLTVSFRNLLHLCIFHFASFLSFRCLFGLNMNLDHAFSFSRGVTATSSTVLPYPLLPLETGI